jgi:hypothetical protein
MMTRLSFAMDLFAILSLKTPLLDGLDEEVIVGVVCGTSSLDSSVPFGLRTDVMDVMFLNESTPTPL